jgi:hypothetical protein
MHRITYKILSRIGFGKWFSRQPYNQLQAVSSNISASDLFNGAPESATNPPSNSNEFIYDVDESQIEVAQKRDVIYPSDGCVIQVTSGTTIHQHCIYQ